MENENREIRRNYIMGGTLIAAGVFIIAYTVTIGPLFPITGWARMVKGFVLYFLQFFLNYS